MIVFVHGVPETPELWDALRAQINEESVAVQLPGFGCARPQGFGATRDDYSEWLVGELKKIGEPVHLVGHDWGAGLTFRVATAHPELLRSWAADVANVAHPDYVWHDFAKIWQTPGDGEAFWESQLSLPPEERAQGVEALGVPHDDAVAMASRTDQTMADCILALYRSALPNPYHDWGKDFSSTGAPGCVLIATNDPFGHEGMAQEVADMLGARVERLDGLGHWWPLEDPAAGADALKRFWKSVA